MQSTRLQRARPHSPNRRLAPRTSCIRGAASLPSTLVRRATAVHHGDRRLERSASVVRSLTVRVESLATFRNPPPTFVPPLDHARCSVPLLFPAPRRAFHHQRLD